MLHTCRALALILLLVVVGSCNQAPSPTLVGAAMSLRQALLDLGEAYEERNPGYLVDFQFAASGVLLQQALQGAPFDVVVFAGEDEMNRLVSADAVVPRTQRVFATNRLVVAIPEGGNAPNALEDLTAARYRRIATGAPATVPVGRYAAQALRNAGLWDEIEPRLLPANNAAQVVEYLQRDEVDAAFLYKSDATEFPWIHVAIEIDPALHEPIRYAAATMREATEAGNAEHFLDLLEGDLGRVVLRRHGFGPPETSP